MSKKLIITESERKEIRRMYNLNEGSGVVDKIMDLVHLITDPIKEKLKSDFGIDFDEEKEKIKKKLEDLTGDERDEIEKEISKDSSEKSSEKSSVESLGKEKVSDTKLFKDLNNKLNYPELSAGLVANVKFESDFNYTAAGDGGSYANSKSQSINVDGKNYCSFGLFQMNICGGLGNEFLKYFNLEESSSSEKYEALTDYDKQIEFITYYLKNKKSAPSGKSAEELSKWFTMNVERPTDKEKKANMRAAWLTNRRLNDYGIETEEA